MPEEKRGMEAVISKTSAVGRPRKPVMLRKGRAPGMAVMIAIGKPKGEKDDAPSMREELDASKGEGMSKAEKIAALEEKIGYLKAELALLKDGMSDDEMMDESEDEMDDESEDDED